jgi:hypothetical protein
MLGWYRGSALGEFFSNANNSSSLRFANAVEIVDAIEGRKLKLCGGWTNNRTTAAEVRPPVPPAKPSTSARC